MKITGVNNVTCPTVDHFREGYCRRCWQTRLSDADTFDLCFDCEQVAKPDELLQLQVAYYRRQVLAVLAQMRALPLSPRKLAVIDGLRFLVELNFDAAAKKLESKSQ
jgi:hypothetical protein